jgi:peptidoglycan/xylan/chitin deacetylase (PgdA/CDA1 family)
MYYNYLKKTKVNFIISIVLMLLMMVVSINTFKSDATYSWKNLSRIFSFYSLKYNNSGKIYDATGNKNLEAYSESVPVLLYHGIVENDSNSEVNKNNFIEQMIMLKSHGYHTVSLEEFIDFMQGKVVLPRKSVLITFDDSRKDSFYNSDPILKSLGFKALMFVITGHSLVDNSNVAFHLSKNELRLLAESENWQLESHGQDDHDQIIIDQNGNKGHFLTNKQWLKNENREETDPEFNKRIIQDLIDSKLNLESEFGIKANGFAFPFGDNGQNPNNFPESKDYLDYGIKTIYPASFYQVNDNGEPLYNYPDKDKYSFKRIEVLPNWSASDLNAVLEKGINKKFPFIDSFQENVGWMDSWGNLSLQNNSLILNSDSNGTGAQTFLDGSRNWQDYAYESDLQWKKGENIYLLARYQNSNNFLSFHISKKQISIEEKLDGEVAVLAKESLDFNLVKDIVLAGIKIDGDKAQGMINGKVIIEASVDPKLDRGGIGLKVYDKVPNNCELVVSSVYVGDDWRNKDNTVYNLSNLGNLELPFYSAELNIDQGWKKTWGEMDFQNGKLSIGSGVENTGSQVYLNGSKNLENYIFSSKVDWVKGSNIIFVARYIDDLNYLDLNISKDSIRLEQYIDGKKQILREIQNTRAIIPENLIVNMKLKGQDIECSLGNSDKVPILVHKGISERLSRGGVGFKTWDEAKGNSRLNIKEVSISPYQ